MPDRARKGLLRRMCALACVLLAAQSVAAADREFRFERIGLEEGLSQASARVVLTDRNGWLWVATQEGPNRYDGYGMKVYQHDPADPRSLSDNNVVALHEDTLGQLWVGTLNGGLNRFDPLSGQFHRLPVDGAAPDSPIDRWVRVITSDAQGRLWLGTPKGLDR